MMSSPRKRASWLIAGALCLGVLVTATAPATSTNAAVSSIGPIMVGPAPGFGPANPTGCDPASTSSLNLGGTLPFEPPAGPVVNSTHVKVSGMPGVTTGTVSVAGDVELGPQVPTGVSGSTAFVGPILAANGSFSLSSGSVFVEGWFSELRTAPPGQPTGQNIGSCYGWDGGDSDPVTASALVMSDLRVAFTGTWSNGGAPQEIVGTVTIQVSSGCAIVTRSTGVCGNSASLVFEPAAPPSCVAAPPGMIGWWRGEVDNQAEVGPDLSGLSAYSPGRVGLGFALGPGTILEASTLPEVGDGLTLEAWIQPAMVRGMPATVMARWDFPSTDDSARSYWLRVDPFPAGSIVFETDDTSTRRPEVLTAVVPDSADFRYHVAATWSPTSIDLYVDGVLVASTPSQGGRLNAAATTPFRIGSQMRGFGYDGLIDEPAVYDRALTATEIAAIAAAGSAGKCPI